MRDEVVWITGASEGIGRALAVELAGRGARLILSARRPEALAAVQAALPDPERAIVLPLDIERPETFDAAVTAAIAWQGRIDRLIQSVGVTQRSAVLDTTPETAYRLIHVNFLGVADLSARALPHLISRRGHLVVLSSVAGHVATPKRAYYAASKHALRAWADALRAELHGTGAAVTTVSPGYIATGISGRGLNGDGTARGAVDQVDARGLDPAVAARTIADGIVGRRREVIVGGRETWAILLQRLFPGLVARFLHRASPR